MKTYAYIILLLVSYYSLSGCRSNRSLSEVSKRDTELHITEKDVSTTQSESTIHAQTNSNKNTDEKAVVSATSENEKLSKTDEFEETTECSIEFNADGSISKITNRTNRRGSVNSTTERAGSSHVSNLSKEGNEQIESNVSSETNVNQTNQTNTDIIVAEKEKQNIEEDNISDSRILQGVEWLYVVGIVAAAVIFLLIRYGRKRSR